jgi:hypothetical protein
LDEEVPLSAIFAFLQIQGIYRRSTGNRDFHFFGSEVASLDTAGAPLKQDAPEAVGLRTRECHSALTAMRRSHAECKRGSIYPRYSGVRPAVGNSQHLVPNSSPGRLIGAGYLFHRARPEENF